MRLLTWNLRGLSKDTPNYQELARLDSFHHPDIIALTETRLFDSATGRKSCLRAALPEHEIWHGYSPFIEKGQVGKGGVALAIRRTLTEHKGGEAMSTPKELRPYVLPVTLTSVTHQQGILVVALYVPPGDQQLRRDICAEVTSLLEAASSKQQPAILLGDINTGLTPQDYHPSTSWGNHDPHFLTWMHTHGLQPFTSAPQFRHHTYEEFREDGTHYSSRLDDILLNPLACLTREGDTGEVVHTQTVGSDHYPVSCTLSNVLLGVPTQPPALERSPYHHTRNPLLKLNFPTIKTRLATPHFSLDLQVHKLTRQCTEWLSDPNSPHFTTDQCEVMGRQIQELFLALQATVTTPAAPTKPYKHWSRKHSHVLQKNRDQVNKAKLDLTALHSKGGDLAEIAEAKAVLDLSKANMKQDLQQESQQRIQAHKDKAAHQYHTNRKQTHRNIFRPKPTAAQTGNSLEAVFHPTTRQLRTDGAGIKEAIHTFMGELVCPAIPPSTDHPTPPWEVPGAPDPMQLHAAPADTGNTLQQLVQDRLGFYNQLHHLSKGKATGPDGLANEAVSGAPMAYKHLLHLFICCLWHKQYTPPSWAKSHTYLLHKKGDMRELSNYRPLAMANILGKVWTGTLSRVLSHYAETHNILSSTQEGFRAQKNSLRQVRNVINGIEDAKLYNKNLYLLYIDFTNAFNMVQHHLLYTILQWLGVPDQMRECVRSLYTEATTQFITPAGLTEPTPITRGTLQGDTLSPLLFLLYVEPLHRWLHQGGRGYEFGCLTPAENVQHRMASAGFADDTSALTNTLENITIQAQKFTLFSLFAGLPMSLRKCAITAAFFP